MSRHLSSSSPETTIVIMLGASEWAGSPDEFPKSEAFKNAAEKMQRYFLKGFGIPQGNILWRFDTSLDASGINRDISTFLDERASLAQTVIVYYTGHAKPTEDFGIYLAIRDTQHYNPEGTSLRIKTLSDTIWKRGRALARYYLLDCCFSAKAITYLQGVSEVDFLQSDLSEEMQRGGYAALFSSDKMEPSVILPDDSNTFFSEALWQVLSQEHEQLLSLSDLRSLTNTQLDILYKGYLVTHPNEVHRPPFVQLHPGSIADIPFFPGKPLISVEVERLEEVGDRQESVKPKRDTRRGMLIRVGTAVLGILSVFSVTSFQEQDKPYPVQAQQTKALPLRGSVSEIAFSEEYVSSLAWATDAEEIVYGLTSNKFDIATASKLEKLFEDKLGYSCTSVALSPDSKLLAVGGYSSEVHLYDYGRRLLQITIPTGQSTINALAWSRDGRYLAMAGDKIILWDVTTNKTYLEYTEHKDIITGLDFSSDGVSFASASMDETVKIWEIGTLQSIHTLNHRDDKRDFPRYVYAVAYSSDGSLIGSASSEGFVRLWNAKDPTIAIPAAPGHTGAARVLAWIPGERLLVSGGDDGFVHVWDEHGDEKGNYPMQGKGVSAIAFSPRSKLLAIADRSGKLSLYERDVALIEEPAIHSA
jgi:WD40 repeat protein